MSHVSKWFPRIFEVLVVVENTAKQQKLSYMVTPLSAWSTPLYAFPSSRLKHESFPGFLTLATPYLSP